MIHPVDDPDEIDQRDLDEGRDLGADAPMRQPRPTRHAPGSVAKVEAMVLRYELRLGLFHAHDAPPSDAPPDPRPAPPDPRPRRPSELIRTAEYRAADAARKRASRRGRRDAA